ncbi:MFS transporter [Diaminobutyricibacter sp. McL0618]|uniref:MFS transporter n=1 Tax=Leifsonia sp. McL0618 TaxID=3415677 RepID=UPI003CF721F2
MNTAPVTNTSVSVGEKVRLPWAALLVMSLTAFALITTETMPAGLLSQIAAGMDVSEGTAGQYVSAYALGTVIFAIPIVSITRGVRRKRLLLLGLLAFLIVNTITALTSSIVLALSMRFIAGIFSGLLWGMLAGYARRITTKDLAGRALAVASIGTPIGLALGTPLGSWLGTTFDWRWAFGALSILVVVTMGLVAILVPDAPGQHAETHKPIHFVLRLPGVGMILAVVVVWMLAHNTLYTYFSVYLRDAGIAMGVDVAFVIFGISALVGIGITGALIDRAIRPLIIASVALFVIASVIFLVGHDSETAVIIAIVLWGVAYGGAAPQLQTAMSEATGHNADVGNAVLGVAFNLAIFSAGVLGALLISGGGLLLPVVIIGLTTAALVIAIVAPRASFRNHRVSH